MTAETLKTISHEALDSIKATNVRLRFYDGSTAKPKGEITIEVEVQHGLPVNIKHGSKRGKLEIVLINGPSDRYPLLSADTCEKLKLATATVSVHHLLPSDANNTEQQSRETVINHYKDVFDGLGKLPGEYHICLKPGIKPVQHAPRKVPIHLRPQLKEQLERLEERKVIARVTEPTEWISSLVLVQKPNKLRICLKT